jgi:hypothetical protein
MSTQDDSWLVKWKFLIFQLKNLIAQKGKQMIVYNVEAMMNPERQYKRY